MSSRQLSSRQQAIKKSRACVFTFYKNIQIAIKTIHYLYSPMKRQIFSFSGVPTRKDGARIWHFVLFLNKKNEYSISRSSFKKNARGVKIFYF